MLVFDNPRVNGGHLALTSRRELVVVSAPRVAERDPGGVSIREGARLHTLAEPADVVRRMTGETLSLAIHERSSVVGVTNPDGDLLTFWDFRRGKLVKATSIEHPRGITLTRDQRWFIVSHGKRPALSWFSTATLDPDPKRHVEGANMSASHMYTWEL
jgi:hypothetical protein